MVFLLQISLLLLISSSLSSCLAQSFNSRKELRDGKVGAVNLSYLNHSGRIDPSRAIQLSWRPRVFSYRGLLSDEECDHLISLVNDAKEKSSGNSDKEGEDVSRVLLDTEDGTVSRVEEIISYWTFLPKENSKPSEVTRYRLEEAKSNLNYFDRTSFSEANESLMATLILYLSNVPHGGGILFPELEKGKIQLDCTKSRNTLNVVKGNAILFFSVHPNTSPDNSSSHIRCPLLEGEMWCATKFFHLRPIISRKKVLSLDSDSGECTDEVESCPQWAAVGCSG